MYELLTGLFIYTVGVVLTSLFFRLGLCGKIEKDTAGLISVLWPPVLFFGVVVGFMAGVAWMVFCPFIKLSEFILKVKKDD